MVDCIARFCAEEECIVVIKLELSKKSAVPIYEQIRRSIVRLIEEGQLRPGELLPSENELAATYNISRMTARNAINELTRDGLVIRVPGKGTFVAQPKKPVEVTKLRSFTQIAEDLGLVPGARILTQRTVDPTEKVAELLRLSEGEKAVEVVRVRTVNETPVMLVRSFYPSRLCSALVEIDLTDQSMYRLLEEELGLKLGGARQFMEACNASEYVATLLNLEVGTAVVRLERELFLEDGTPVEYFTGYAWTKQFKFKFELVR